MENKIYTEKTRKLRQNTQKIANFLRHYGKIHSKLPIFRVKSVKIYTGQFFFTQTPSVVSVTNMRYVSRLVEYFRIEVSFLQNMSAVSSFSGLLDWLPSPSHLMDRMMEVRGHKHMDNTDHTSFRIHT